MRRRLRVVSWNVGRLYSPSHNNRLDDADVPRVAQVLGELDGDVLLLQELVGEAQLETLIVQLHHEQRGQFAGELARACRYDRKVAILVRRAWRPRFEEQWLGSSGRSALLASFDLGEGARAAAVSAHLDVFSPERRAEQGAALAALAESRAEPLLMVGGDFNLDPAAAAALRNRLDVETFARLTERLDDAGRAAGPTLLGLLRVDHLLVRGAGSRIVRVSPRRLPLGDHHPLVLDVDLDNA